MISRAQRHAGTWLAIPEDHPFGLHTLPYGSFTLESDSEPSVGVAIGDHILDLTATTTALLPESSGIFREGNLDRFLAAGPAVWHRVRAAVREWLSDSAYRPQIEPRLLAAEDVRMWLPFSVADYVDYYASEDHATNLGRMFRPDGEPLTANWKHLPIGYHGRAGTVVVSGTPIVRPRGLRGDAAGAVVFGPSTRLDIEAEVGFVVGRPSMLGQSVPLTAFADHVFGVCLVNDWSARDIQSFEYVPLGPFLGKSFATSVSAWVVPLSALEHARVAPPHRDIRPAPYLDDSETDPWGFDIRLQIALNGHVVSRPPFASMYWTAAQQLAHMTVNGASLRTGDLFASGTISGPAREQRGSFIELAWNGAEPLVLPDGTERAFLADGDEVVISATAPGPNGSTIGLGEVRGRVIANPT